MSSEFESDIAQICKVNVALVCGSVWGVLQDEGLGEAGASKLIDSLEAGIDIFEPLEKKLRIESLKKPYGKVVSAV